MSNLRVVIIINVYFQNLNELLFQTYKYVKNILASILIDTVKSYTITIRRSKINILKCCIFILVNSVFTFWP